MLAANNKGRAAKMYNSWSPAKIIKENVVWVH